MEDLGKIKETRVKLGLTQQQLAKAAGISQSLLAKIEAGKVEPSYRKAICIINALQNVKGQKERKAKDIMHVGVESVRLEDSLHEAVQKMRKKNISQLAVSDGKKIVGSISEQGIIRRISLGQDLSHAKVADALDEAFPVVLYDSPISSFLSLLQYYPAVLVSRQGEIVGIITKADILKAV
ncbi:MAG: CBS domain-containing protein [Candidatus Micrarchaeota archaeon]|nr:CBS domain-containing protein [Candidatus Micrarchaeota archaeon]